MVSRRSRAVLGAAMLGLGLAASGQVLTASADEASTVNRLAYLTFKQSVALPNVQLTPGTYIFELADPLDAPGVVRVSSRDRSTVYLMAFTRSVPRPNGLSALPVVFGEARAGTPRPITVWYPFGEVLGREFIYPR